MIYGHEVCCSNKKNGLISFHLKILIPSIWMLLAEWRIKERNHLKNNSIRVVLYSNSTHNTMPEEHALISIIFTELYSRNNNFRGELWNHRQNGSKELFYSFAGIVFATIFNICLISYFFLFTLWYSIYI